MGQDSVELGCLMGLFMANLETRVLFSFSNVNNADIYASIFFTGLSNFWPYLLKINTIGESG